MALNENLTAPPGDNELPVDWERMTDLTGGETDGLRDLVDLHFEQTARQITDIETAIRNNQPDAVRREAHSCGGASATLGMTRLAAILRELESQGKASTLTNATELCTAARTELVRIREFLAPRLP
jgi:HPt (histidine-containing phosphotransfer) domain-containing protein